MQEHMDQIIKKYYKNRDSLPNDFPYIPSQYDTPPKSNGDPYLCPNWGSNCCE